METAVQDISSGNDGQPACLPLPLDLQEWARRHEPLISRLSHSITVTAAPLSESALWGIIAEHYSGDWKEKREELQRAESRLAKLMAPENMPLGLVGAALHSDETTAAEQHHTLALADFTIIDETLRQQRELHGLLGALLDYQRTLNKSLDLSRSVLDVTQAFDAVADKKPASGGLSLSFKQIAAKLRRKPSPKTKTPEMA